MLDVPSATVTVPPADARPSCAGLATALLAVVMLGKLLVPGGWMPVQTARGIEMTLCSGAAPMRLWLDDAGKLHKGEQPGHDSGPKDPCPFGALAAPVQPGAAPLLAAVQVTATPAPRLAAAATAVGRGLAAPPPPATGPPYSA